jgi:hypothetical protein
VAKSFRVARHWAAAAFVLAALVAGSATAFGFEFAPEPHGHEEAADTKHAEDERAGPEGEEAAHEEEGEGEDEDEDGAGMVVSAILIGLAGGALAPLTGLVAVRREGEGPADRRALAMGLPLQLALLSTGAAVVHFAVVAQHLDEWWLTGLFFIVVALFQLAWALLVLMRPSALVYLSGAVVNSLVVVTWIVSRTSGVPVGPDDGEREPIGFPDVLATAFEVLLVALVVALVLRPRGRVPRWPVATAWLSAAIAALLTACALAVLA